MPIAVTCRCGRKITAPDSLRGKQTICPDCGDHFVISDESRQSAAPKVETPSFAPIPTSFSCPNCGGDQTQKVSVICEVGTQHKESSFFGSGLAIGGNLDIVPAFAGGSAKSTSQSSLALRLGPPKMPVYIPVEFIGLAQIGIVLLFAVGFCGIGLAFQQWYTAASGAIIGILVGVPLATSYAKNKIPLWQARNRERQEGFEARLARWQREYFCHRCGTTFMPE